MPEGLIIGLILAVLAQSAALATLWRKIGQLESIIKKACPFGKCPFYERAIEEAAPEREILLKIQPVVERVKNIKE